MRALLRRVIEWAGIITLAVAATLILGLAFGFITITASKAEAQGRCMPYPALERMLIGQRSEQNANSGIAGKTRNARILQVWVHPETKDWTIILLRPNDTACIMASGTHWMDRPLLPGEQT